jgi:hypothetical protein
VSPSLSTTFAFDAAQSSPHGKIVDEVPRAAYSHCASVGSAPPRHAAYASLSYHVMQTRG